VGHFRLTHETNIAAGIRRIEAITSYKADEYIEAKIETLKQVSSLMKNPKDVIDAVDNLMKINSNLKKKIARLSSEKISRLAVELVESAEQLNDLNYIGARLSIDAKDAKDLAFKLKGKVKNLVVVLATEDSGKAGVTVMVDDQLVKDRELNAGTIVKELAKEIKGGGGGQAFFATAGGNDVSGLDRVLEKSRSLVQ